ncbi:MAG: protein kinase [Deltaproteobacteria bacterium]|nr:protein kinase [Deltaproteobacteria bacterium]
MPLAPATTAEPIGRIGRFAVLAELPAGGMARVFLSKKDGASDLCVLKQLHVELERHSTAATRLKREAHLVSHLNHPNIARIVDAGVEDGKFCTATEYIAGQMLESVMEALAKNGSILPPAMSVFIAAQILSGLEHAHNLVDPDGVPLRIVHRDLSPRNIMVGFNGDVKVIDFGVAQGKIDDFKTAPGMMVGTLRYMAPEQALTRSTDQRTDLYTVAVVLYEMLTGKPVVQEGRAIQVLTAVIEDSPPMAHTVNTILPRALGEVVAKGLAKDPSDRWQTAKAFRDAMLEAGRSLNRPTREYVGRLVRELFPAEAREAAHYALLAQRLRSQERAVEAAAIADRTSVSPMPTNGVPVPTSGSNRALSLPSVSPRSSNLPAIHPREPSHAMPSTEDIPLLSDRDVSSGDFARSPSGTEETPLSLPRSDSNGDWNNDPTTPGAVAQPRPVAIAEDLLPLDRHQPLVAPAALARANYAASDQNEPTLLRGRFGREAKNENDKDAVELPTRVGIERPTLDLSSSSPSYDQVAYAETSPSIPARDELIAPRMPVTSDPDAKPARTASKLDAHALTTLPMLPAAQRPMPVVQVPAEVKVTGVETREDANYLSSLEQQLSALKGTIGMLKSLVFALLIISGVLLGLSVFLLARASEDPHVIKANVNAAPPSHAP